MDRDVSELMKPEYGFKDAVLLEAQRVGEQRVGGQCRLAQGGCANWCGTLESLTSGYHQEALGHSPRLAGIKRT